MVRFCPPLFIVLSIKIVQGQHEQTYDAYRPRPQPVSRSYERQQGSQVQQLPLNSQHQYSVEDFGQGGLRKANVKANGHTSGDLVSEEQQMQTLDSGMKLSRREGDTGSLGLPSVSNPVGALSGSGTSETHQRHSLLEGKPSMTSEKSNGDGSPYRMSSDTSLRGDSSPYIDSAYRVSPTLSSSGSMSDSFKKTKNTRSMQSGSVPEMVVSSGNRLGAGSSSSGGIETNTLDTALSNTQAYAGPVPNSHGKSDKIQLQSGVSALWSDDGLLPKSEQSPVGRQPDQETFVRYETRQIDGSFSGKLYQYPEKVPGYPTGGRLSKYVEQPRAYDSNTNGFSFQKVTGGTRISHDDGSSIPQDLQDSRTEKNTPLPNASPEIFNVQEDLAECNPLTPREIKVTPTWISSFPGSGSKMSWRSIEAITGLFVGDDLDSTGKISKGVAVAVTTHYPSHTQENVFRQKKFQNISRGILVLRNPMLAIPSIFRFVYFVEQGNERKSKSDQPPGHAWAAWRDEYLDSELKLWIDHTQWWLDNYKRENLHLLPFEYFVSAQRGSDELQKLGNFLGSADENIAAALLAPEKFCCVWEKMVNHEDNDPESKAAPPYTLEQLEAIIQALIRLRDYNKSFPEFNKLMDEYIGTVVLVKKSILATKNTAEA